MDRKDNIELLETVEEVSGDEVDADYTEYMTGTAESERGFIKMG